MLRDSITRLQAPLQAQIVFTYQIVEKSSVPADVWSRKDSCLLPHGKLRMR